MKKKLNKIFFLITLVLLLIKPTFSLLNPAAVYCEKMGYEYIIQNTQEGQIGVCKFPDGSICSDWNFLNGRCGQEKSYCVKNGYELRIINEQQICGHPGQCAVCVLPDGRKLEITELMNLDLVEGECGDNFCLSGFEDNQNCPQDCKLTSGKVFLQGMHFVEGKQNPENVKVLLRIYDSVDKVIFEKEITLNANGEFTFEIPISIVPEKKYNVTISKHGYLTSKIIDVKWDKHHSTNLMWFGFLTAGDVTSNLFPGHEDNYVNGDADDPLSDFNYIYSRLGKNSRYSDWNENKAADINEDGSVSKFDLDLVKMNKGARGDILAGIPEIRSGPRLQDSQIPVDRVFKKDECNYCISQGKIWYKPLVGKEKCVEKGVGLTIFLRSILGRYVSDAAEC